MSRARVDRTLRWSALALATIVVANAVTSDPAEARRRRHAPAAASSAPPYASLVVDANTGAVLQNTNGDALRHPASLTKIMTLYLLFERLEAGKISLASEFRVSAHAASQAPSKLNLSPGETIGVEDAIKAIVTKSANDVAVVVAENLAGDEASFARLMTQKARALGMKNTTYLNASGLPNEDQWTTARDQVTLGRAIQERFPRYYKYFSTRNFVFEGKSLRNHNKLLGEVEGVDGIKTGYTNASGFNLVTSVRRAGRYVVAAVFGGRTGRARDAQMHALIEKHTMSASVKRTAPAIVENAEGAATRVAAVEKPAEVRAEAKIEKPEPKQETRIETRTEARTDARSGGFSASSDVVNEMRAAAYAPQVGSLDPIKPNVVKTVTVKGPNVRTAALVPPAQHPVAKTAQPDALVATEPKSDLPPPPPGARPGVLGVLPVQVASADPAAAVAPAASSARTAAPVAAAAAPVAPAPAAHRGGWFIQVGALETEKEAKERLAAARGAAKSLLKGAEAYTETVTKGSKTFYRARFAGLSEHEAEAACREIKSNKIVCMPAKN